jgi:hypothetical protein
MFALNSPQVKKGLLVNGMIATPGDSTQLRAMIYKEYKKFGKVVEERRIHIN